jgi:hypothetical protein
LQDSAGIGEYGHTVNQITFSHKNNTEDFLQVLLPTDIKENDLMGFQVKLYKITM